MTVSDLARHVGITPSAVRFYERRGALPPPARQANGYRDYTDDDAERLRVLVSLRSLGLDVGAAGRLAAMCVAGQCDAMARDLAPLVEAQRAAVVRARADLDALDRQLERLQQVLSSGDPDWDFDPPQVWRGGRCRR